VVFRKWGERERKLLGKEEEKRIDQGFETSHFFYLFLRGGREMNRKWRGKKIDQGYRTSNRFLHIFRGGRGKIWKGREKENRSGLVTGQVTVILPILRGWKRKWLGKVEKKRMG
jgi:hypothetical protein